MTDLDRDGQPPEPINYNANLRKATESLLGLCRGLIADQALNEKEVVFLDTWLKDNAIVLDRWPGNVIGRRVREVLADGKVSDEEEQDLIETLSEITGIDLDQGIVSGLSNQIETRSAPEIVRFQDASFCFTGKFVYGPRYRVEAVAQQLGAYTSQDMTMKVDYLVIGGLASRDWAHTSHGRKIEKAVEYRREKGLDIRIIEEKDWTNALNAALE